MKSSPLKKSFFLIILMFFASHISVGQIIAQECENARPWNVRQDTDASKGMVLSNVRTIRSETIGSLDTDKFEVTGGIIPRDSFSCDFLGAVIDRKTRKPIQGVEIMIHDEGWLYDRKIDTNYAIHTGKEGRFHAADGTYTCFSVVCSARGYRCLEIKNIVMPDHPLIIKMLKE